ncbi:MAG: IS110 family transposase [Bacteroidales bacterium]|nr:IS110 family transposase [Bacteroidales bacterium]
MDKACGLGIHKDTIIGFISDNKGRNQVMKKFKTFTSSLKELVQWMLDNNVKYCLMESTGVYWITLYHLLTEAGISVMVANPMHIKQIPKRKTDKKDARWLCMLLLNGLVRPSFIPESQQYELREYCRARQHYIYLRSQLLNRIVRILERANIKIRSVVSNIRIKSSMEIIRLLAEGEQDINKYIASCKGRLKKKIAEMREALQGQLTNADRDMLKFLLGDIEHIEANLKLLEEKIEEIVSNHYAQAVELLQHISGVGKQSAQVIVSEIGTEMKKFPTADHLTSWTGLAPGNHESAGKRKSVSTKKRNKYLRTAMVAIAWGAVRTKNSYWGCLFEHLKKRMKPQKAIVVIARRLLKVVYKTLNEGIIYEEGGVELFTKIQLENRARAQARFLKKQMQQKMSNEQKDDLFLESQKSGTQVA